jgi:hypothetical protein
MNPPPSDYDLPFLEFERRLKGALDQFKRILDSTKHPIITVRHSYTDKYLLAEFLANICYSSLLNDLEHFGLDRSTLEAAAQWPHASLLFESCQTCELIEKRTRVEKSDRASIAEIGLMKIKSYVETKIEEYVWKVAVDYKLTVYKGANVLDCKTLGSNKYHTTVVTATDVAPYPKSSLPISCHLEITTLLKSLSNLKFDFKIDRNQPTCYTPRRNDQIEDFVQFLKNATSWFQQIGAYILNNVFKMQKDHALDLSCINSKDVFIPVFPLFDDSEPKVFQDLEPLLIEAHNSVLRKLETVRKAFESSQGGLVNSELSTFATMSSIIITKCVTAIQSVEYIEHMLLKQLNQAIGKTLTPTDVGEYMRYHYRKFFNPQFIPSNFSFPIRREGYAPEGEIMIQNDGKCIQTFACKANSTERMHFALNVSTKVEFTGERILHGWIDTAYSQMGQGTTLEIIARARQFSSYIMMLGRIAANDSFEPEHAIIVQNKDEYKIALNCETIPSAKQFNDSIESLSPEQQRFAKAFRSMQLGGTIFAMLTIQIKPQLEKVLKIPKGSITKELKLTQDLMKLFIAYQIPADLLSFEGTSTEHVKVIQENVAKIMNVIDQEQKLELEESNKRAVYNIHEQLAQASLAIPVPSSAPSKPYKKMSAPMTRMGRSSIPQMGASMNAFGAPQMPQSESFDMGRSSIPQMDASMNAYCDVAPQMPQSESFDFVGGSEAVPSVSTRSEAVPSVANRSEAVPSVSTQSKTNQDSLVFVQDQTSTSCKNSLI